MRRLYLRIYVAVLASIILAVVLAGAAWRILGDWDRATPEPALIQEMAGALLPPQDAPAELQREALERWSRASGLSLALRDDAGRMIARSGHGQWEGPHGRMGRWRGGGPGRFSVDLPDGRTLMVLRSPMDRAAPRGLGQLRGMGWLLALGAVGVAVAICAWPVVRRLTRDIEELEKGVAALGEGDLSARAPVRGADEVARLAATFNRAADRIEALMRANRTLLANASHELRSPLTRLRMSVEALKDSAPPAVRTELQRNVRELDQLVEEILLASRIDAGRVEAPAREEVDLVALAAEECARAGADLDATPDVVLQADARLLRRALRNLIENAARHGGAPADVALSRSGGRIRVDVCDRGPGVSEAERERIFEPFYRLPGAAESDGGVGLGLSLARRIAQLHGGSLVCLPREGGGACFRLELPDDVSSAAARA